MPAHGLRFYTLKYRRSDMKRTKSWPALMLSVVALACLAAAEQPEVFGEREASKLLEMTDRREPVEVRVGAIFALAGRNYGGMPRVRDRIFALMEKPEP